MRAPSSPPWQHSLNPLHAPAGGTFRLEGGAAATYARHGRVALRTQATFLNQSSGEADAAALLKLLLDASAVYDKVFVASGKGTWYPNIEFATNPYVVRRAVLCPAARTPRLHAHSVPSHAAACCWHAPALPACYVMALVVAACPTEPCVPLQANSAGRGTGVKPAVGRELALHFTLKLQARGGPTSAGAHPPASYTLTHCRPGMQ